MQVRGNTPVKPIQLSTVWVSPFLGFLRYFIGNWERLCEVCLSQMPFLSSFFFFLLKPELAAFQRHSRPEGMIQCIFLHVLLCKCHVTATEIHIKMTRRPHWSSSALQQSYCQRCILPSSHWSHSHLKPTRASAPNCFPLCSCHQRRGIRERPVWSSIPNCLQ